MAYTHAIVWMDHTEARVIHLDEANHEAHHVKSPHGKEHLHHKRGSVGDGNASAHADFFGLIVKALGGAQEILVVGPASAKNEFVKHAGAHDAQFAKRVIAVENMDHPSENQLVAHARKYFVAADRMRPL